MVSKARDDLPDPDSPVMTTSLSRGISTSTFLRLCSRAPLTTILFIGVGTSAKSANPEPHTVSDCESTLEPPECARPFGSGALCFEAGGHLGVDPGRASAPQVSNGTASTLAGRSRRRPWHRY